MDYYVIIATPPLDCQHEMVTVPDGKMVWPQDVTELVKKSSSLAPSSEWGNGGVSTRTIIQ